MSFDGKKYSLPFTGERYVPGAPSTEYLGQEHIIRYLFAAQFVKGKRVLDIACGAGYGCDILANAGASEVIGIDNSSDAILYCQQKYNRNNIKFEKANAISLPFKDKSFDIITAFEFIEHIKEDKIFLTEVKRLLSDDGIFILSTPNKKVYGLDNPFETKQENPFHEREYYENEFTDLLKDNFKNVSIRYQLYPNTMAILSPYAADDVKELNVPKGSVYNKKEVDANYFIGICSNNKLDFQTSFVYLFKDETLFQANYKEFKNWIKKLDSDNRSFLEQISKLQENNLANQKIIDYDSSKINQHVQEIETLQKINLEHQQINKDNKFELSNLQSSIKKKILK